MKSLEGYNTSSDIRLKENIKATTHGINEFMQINVKDYNYIGDKQYMTGMIAQELYKTIPTAVRAGGDDVKTNY